MARYYNSAAIVLLLQALLVFPSSAHSTNGNSLSLEDRLQQIIQDFVNYKVNMNDVLGAKDARLEVLEAQIERQQEMITALQQQIDERPTAYSRSFAEALPIDKNINNLTHPMAATAGMPKSCAGLRYLGHTANGLYLIMGSEQVETVYCDFSALPTDPSFQTWIGEIDIKSLPVYFYVQRNNIFSTAGTPIPFELERLNLGNAMNLTSGIFTAPRAGIYSFSFTEEAYLPISSSRVHIYVFMYLNGNVIVSGMADEVSTADQYDTFSFQCTLDLKVGDEIWLEITGMSTRTYLNGGIYSHFSGWLMKEDISKSLKNVK